MLYVFTNFDLPICLNDIFQVLISKTIKFLILSNLILIIAVSDNDLMDSLKCSFVIYFHSNLSRTCKKKITKHLDVIKSLNICIGYYILIIPNTFYKLFNLKNMSKFEVFLFFMCHLECVWISLECIVWSMIKRYTFLLK